MGEQETYLPKLFEPGRIGSLELKNRLIMAAMGSSSSESGSPTPRMIDYYSARARGGVGMVIVEATRVAYESRTPNHLWLYSDEYIPRLRKLSSAIKENGAKVAIQLAYSVWALFRFMHDLENPERIDVMGPSATLEACYDVRLRAATREDIAHCVECFATTTVRAREAGFDAVEFHAAHHTLLSYFLSPFTNKRNDEYGGDAEGRARFVCEIVARARQAVGTNFPLIVRLSGSEFLEGGNTLEDTIIQARLIVEAGADALHISASASPTHQWQFLPYYMEPGALLPLAWRVKQTVDVPVIGVGKINDLSMAEQALEQGKADFIALGRPLLADPDLPNKARQGRFEDIRPCIYCNNCLRPDRERLHGLSCTVNPGLLREREFSLKPAQKPRKIMVVGGGLAGMETARVLAERGHIVTLYEKAGRLGGQWNIASQQDCKQKDYPKLTTYMTRGIDRAGVKVRLNTTVTPDLVRKEKPEVVIVATGALPVFPDVPGADGRNVVQANDVITGKAHVGEKVVVAGGRFIGMEVADFLARQGKKVSLVSRRRIGRDVQRAIYLGLMERLIKSGVYLYPNSPLYEIKGRGIYIIYNKELLFLETDTVVLAVGVTPEKRLFDELKSLVPEVYAIGDCVDPRDAMHAINEGAELGHKI